jgi:hypothetical protein
MNKILDELESLSRGVDYYNKEKQRRIKNNILSEETSESIEKNGLCPISSGLAPASLSHQAKPSAEVSPGSQEESGGVVLVAPEEVAEEFVLTEDFVKRAPIQLWDNGEDQFRRYKLKIRLNLVDGENPDFIANLTKDFRNFKKYIPAECKDRIVNQASQLRSSIKNKFGVYPHMGKFHLATSFKAGKRQPNQIEPWTFAAVWWDPEEKGWSGVLCIHDFALEFDLFENNLTAKQKAAGCKAATLYINSKYSTVQRPMTWAQKRNKK